jgi:GT2 family glycosyltransferase
MAGQPLEKKWTVAAVIVTWNRRDDLMNAIASLKEQTYPCKEILVIDNKSTDGAAAAVRERHPDVDLVELGENLGACTGRNIGTERAASDLILYMDDDAVLDPRCIEEMVGVFQQHPEVGAVMPTYLEPGGQLAPDPERVMLHNPHPWSAAWCVRSDALPANPWPSHFVRQFEEVWVALHVYERGFESVTWPSAGCVHYFSPGGQREKVLYFFTRNSFLTFYQRMPLLLMPPFAIYKAIRPLLTVRSMGQLVYWLKGIGSGLGMILTSRAPRCPLPWSAVRAYLHALRYNNRPVDGGN